MAIATTTKNPTIIKAGLYPSVPVTEDERKLFREEYKRTGEIPLTVGFDD